MNASVFCHDFRKRLPDLLAGRLKSEEEQQLKAHARHCRDCDTAFLEAVGQEMYTLHVARRRAGAAPITSTDEARAILENVFKHDRSHHKREQAKEALERLGVSTTPSEDASEYRMASTSWWEDLTRWGSGLGGSHQRPWAIAAALSMLVLVVSVLWWGLMPLSFDKRLDELARIDPSDTLPQSRTVPGAPADSFQSHFHQGQQALLQSQLQDPQRVDEGKVDEGIHHMEEARKRAENDTQKAECYFYLGKAYLKKRDLARAREQLEVIGRLQGSSRRLLDRRRAAEELIEKIRKLERSRQQTRAGLWAACLAWATL